jgi:endonuclease-3
MASRKPDIAGTIRALKKRFPNPGAMEIGGDPWRVLVAVTLSARTRDEQVLKLLPGFFRAFPTVSALADAEVGRIESTIDTIGMYRQKARNLKKMAGMLVGNVIPSTMEELVALPGVGRKTASVVLASCFGKSAIAVDTHVHRVTNRLGWVRTKTPEQTERALLGLVPAGVMRSVNRVFVKLGRYVCLPGRPRCWDCPVRDACAFPRKNLAEPRDADDVRADIARRERELEARRTSV